MSLTPGMVREPLATASISRAVAEWTLVTNHERDSRRVRGLKIQNRAVKSLTGAPWSGSLDGHLVW